MKNPLTSVLLATAALLCGSTFAGAPQDDDDPVAELEARVAALEARLASQGDGASAAEMAQMRAVVVQTKRQADQIAVYLQAQAESAQMLQKALEEAKTKGFTYGINPESRVTLLAGMDSFAATLQKNVPAPPVESAAKANGPQQPARTR